MPDARLQCAREPAGLVVPIGWIAMHAGHSDLAYMRSCTVAPCETHVRGSQI